MTVDLAWNNSKHLPTFTIPDEQFPNKFIPVRSTAASNASQTPPLAGRPLSEKFVARTVILSLFQAHVVTICKELQ